MVNEKGKEHPLKAGNFALGTVCLNKLDLINRDLGEQLYILILRTFCDFFIHLEFMRKLTLLPLIVGLLMLSGCIKNKNGILPNPNKVYSDQCYVWLKEMPDFFRERHYLDNGLAWDRHSYRGIYVSDNPESMFYSRHYVGHTVVLFRPDEPGGDMKRGNMNIAIPTTM